MLDNKSVYNFTYKNFAAVINKYQYHFHPKDIVAGTIFSIENRFVLVDIGANQVGFLPFEEISLNRIDDVNTYISLNEVRELYILLFDSELGQILLSIKRVELIKAWKRIQQIYAEEAIVKTQMVKLNKGGCIVQLDGLKGFIPKSHLIYINQVPKLVKSTNICVKILEFNESLNYLLLSSRCAYIQQNPHIFKVGNIVQGKIDSIQPYGLFITIEYVQGLLHISEIIQNSDEELDKKFIPRENILVMIIHIDNKQGRITLSQKGIQVN
uniref:ribosomal protein S1 n=1 Tax=Rhodospora sordida TaxID=362230 RepID=UPI001FCDB65E|nr:ribosomal protein S1 [Rhodospora sordida]UNJ15090.1 ribosomal protein S1 [Rhodospora sordida]